MNIERRLHHAARELREVPIDIPPLGTTSTQVHGRRRPVRALQALAAPALFVAGGLFAVGAIDADSSAPTYNDVQGASAALPSPLVAEPIAVSSMSDAPSVLAELEMIAEIVNSNRRANEASAAPVPPPAGGTVPSAALRAEEFGPL